MEELTSIETLLVRYFSGNISPEEARKVETWIALSEENAKVARQIQLLSLASDSTSIEKRIDIDKAHGALSRRIRKDKAKGVFRWVERVAAVLLIPVSMAFFYEMSFKGDAEVQILEARTNPGMTTKLSLSDGTVVNLNSGSTLKYPNTFTGDVRSVQLEGEAFFDVAKDIHKKFVVTTTDGQKVEVHGTSFNLEAFPTDSITTTTLLTGSVTFISGDHACNMFPFQKLVYDRRTGRMTIRHTEGDTETSWKEGKIVFNDTPFNEVLRVLSKRYNVQFIVDTKKYDDDAFTGSFTTQHIGQVLTVFKASSGVRWKYEEANELEKVQRIRIY